MIMVVKSLKCPFTLFSYSNLSDQLPDLCCDPLLVYTTLRVEYCLTSDICHVII